MKERPFFLISNYRSPGDRQAEHLVPRGERASEFADGGPGLGRDGGPLLSASAPVDATGYLLVLVRHRSRRRTTSSRTDGGASSVIFYFAGRERLPKGYWKSYVYYSIDCNFRLRYSTEKGAWMLTSSSSNSEGMIRKRKKQWKYIILL